MLIFTEQHLTLVAQNSEIKKILQKQKLKARRKYWQKNYSTLKNKKNAGLPMKNTKHVFILLTDKNH